MALWVPIAITLWVVGGIGYVMQAGWSPLANLLDSRACCAGLCSSRCH